MRSTRLAATLLAVALTLSVAACGSTGSKEAGTAPASPSSAATQKVMPNVTGKRLDLAEDDIRQAGISEDSIKIVGGGRFGVVKKSNWTVCSQSPAAGQPLPSQPQLTIDRSCPGVATSTAPASSTPASSSATSTSGASSGTTLTAKNSKDLAALLKVSDYCAPSVQGFATKYAGRKIEFDGSITALSPHGSYKTRYDIGVAPGDKGSNSSTGPFFQFQNVNTNTDLHFTGANVPDSIAPDDRIHVVAEVGDYSGGGNGNCILQLIPVSTSFRS